MVEDLKKSIIYDNYLVSKQDALELVKADLEILSNAASEICTHFYGEHIELCAITNGKSGKCSENCKFCAQSTHFEVDIACHSLLGKETLLKDARAHALAGISRFSVVTSGRYLSDSELERVCESYRYIKDQCEIALCASHGLLNYAQFLHLKESGVTRYHNNLETSRRFFPYICTTHTYDDKIDAIKAAQSAGLEVCSGGIMGLGESMEDRIDMALDLRKLNINSVPINVLNAIEGTPLANLKPLTAEEVKRIVSIFRFILPNAVLRLAGGRGCMLDKGKCLFASGINAAISGDMLTTAGITTQTDIAMLQELGFQIGLL